MSQVNREQLKVVAERAVLVGVYLSGDEVDERQPLSELAALTRTAGARVIGELVQRRATPSGRTYLGKGKVEELRALVEMTGASLVIFDNDLTPSQIKAVEEICCCKVIDRSELILDIFANRAATHAAKLQVEIAQLEYTYPRLRAMWSHLGQVTGGAPIGIGTRGPGEKQLEIDRRLVQRRLKQLKRELETVQQRKVREVAKRTLDHFTVGLVGYTNAGKSTLFNALTEGGAYAHDKLFATLSTRIEKWNLGGGNAAMLSDTVGFIRNLPHHLVASFRSTLEETVHAHLLIIVLDVSDPAVQRSHLDVVERTLDDIGATEQPRLIVLNKIDALPDSRDRLIWLNRLPEAVAISARTGDGFDELTQRVREHFLGDVRDVRIEVPLSDAKTLDFIEKRTEVVSREYRNGSVAMQVRIGRRQVDQLRSRGAAMRINGQSADQAIREIWGGDEAEAAPPLLPPHKRLHPPSTEPTSLGWRMRTQPPAQDRHEA